MCANAHTRPGIRANRVLRKPHHRCQRPVSLRKAVPRGGRLQAPHHARAQMTRLQKHKTGLRGGSVGAAAAEGAVDASLRDELVAAHSHRRINFVMARCVCFAVTLVPCAQGMCQKHWAAAHPPHLSLWRRRPESTGLAPHSLRLVPLNHTTVSG